MRPSRELDLRSDGFGFDPEFTERVTKVALWFYRKYWRVEVDGVTNVPGRGRALLVANHAGIVPYDGAMIAVRIIAPSYGTMPAWLATSSARPRPGTLVTPSTSTRQYLR